MTLSEIMKKGVTSFRKILFLYWLSRKRKCHVDIHKFDLELKILQWSLLPSLPRESLLHLFVPKIFLFFFNSHIGKVETSQKLNDLIIIKGSNASNYCATQSLKYTSQILFTLCQKFTSILKNLHFKRSVSIIFWNMVRL